MPRDQLKLLLDDQGTLKNIRAALETILARAKPGSTFIFYYAGHGAMLGKEGRIGFCNYDCAAGREENYLEMNSFAPLLQKHFKGRRVLLLADCCHSGGLAQAAEELSKTGVEAASLTSADRSNISTGNWTFTQAIIDALQGNPLFDADGDGSITLVETAREVAAAMQFRESQRHGYRRFGFPEDWKLAAVDTNRKLPKTVAPPFALKQYVWARVEGKKDIGRIVGNGDGRYTVSLYHYADRSEVRLPADQLDEMVFRRYKEGQDVQVSWGGTLWPARILKVEGDFHYITYPGWDDHWNEWVLATRIKAPPDPLKLVEVEWKGKWYKAELVKQSGERYYISYVDDDSSWDEWVSRDRIRFLKGKE